MLFKFETHAEGRTSARFVDIIVVRAWIFISLSEIFSHRSSNLPGSHFALRSMHVRAIGVRRGIVTTPLVPFFFTTCRGADLPAWLSFNR